MARSPAAPADVSLQAGKGSRGRGDGPGGRYWHVLEGDRRVGHVYINEIDEPPLGPHASLQLQINKADQGRGIGSVVYRLAAEASGRDEIWAHMRKSNRASERAARASGFEVVELDAVRQLLMRWRRPPQLEAPASAEQSKSADAPAP